MLHTLLTVYDRRGYCNRNGIASTLLQLLIYVCAAFSPDSPLAHMSDAIIDYVVGKDLLEPLGGAPTSSIIMQVSGFVLRLGSVTFLPS